VWRWSGAAARERLTVIPAFSVRMSGPAAASPFQVEINSGRSLARLVEIRGPAL